MIPDRFKQTVARSRQNRPRAIRVASILLVVGLLIAAPVVAQSGYVIEDFGPASNTGDFQLDSNSDNAYSGTYSIRRTGGNAGIWQYDLNDKNPDSISMRFKFENYDGFGESWLRIYKAPGERIASIGVHDDSGVRYTSDSGAVAVSNYTAPTGAYFTLSFTNISYASNTVDVKYNGNLILTRTSVDFSEISHVEIDALQDMGTFNADYLTANGADDPAGVHEVYGTVTDERGTKLSNVTVEISNADGQVAQTTTGEDGKYNISIVEGSYTATFSKDGYSTESTQFEVSEGRVRVNAELTEERLVLDTRQLYQPGATHDYRVLFTTGNGSQDVTDSATVTSLNSSILTVNQGQQTMTAVDDKNVSQVVTVNMSYQTYSAQAEIVVAEATVDNLAILPTGLSRGQAVMLDDFIFALLIAAFLSVPASRFANAFAGLGVAEMVIVVGWLGGFVPLGIAMLSIFMAMFVGLNLAANIDYAMRR